MSGCTWQDESIEPWGPVCGRPATEFSCVCPGDRPNVCAEHKCRCAQPATLAHVEPSAEWAAAEALLVAQGEDVPTLLEKGAANLDAWRAVPLDDPRRDAAVEPSAEGERAGCDTRYPCEGDIRCSVHAVCGKPLGPNPMGDDDEPCNLDPGHDGGCGLIGQLEIDRLDATIASLRAQLAARVERERRADDDAQLARYRAQVAKSENGQLRAQLAAVTKERDEALHWEDAEDEWTKEIDAAHSVRSGSHKEYAIAMRMVGARHSKGSLVALINWLLVRSNATKGDG